MTHPYMIVLRLQSILLFLFLLIPLQGFAQVADTTVVPPDTTGMVAPDSVALPATPAAPSEPIVFKTPVPFIDDEPGIVVHDTLPALHPALDPVGILSESHGSFLYDFGASGWPDGWSPYGIASHDVSLNFNSISFENSVTGTAQYELLPFSMLQPLQLQAGRFGDPMAVNTRLRALGDNRPTTEIRYRQSSLGLKSVLVFHNQRRNIPLRKQNGVLGITLAYGGHGANGEYGGSRLAGARQLLTRLRYEHPWGAVELLNLTNRRRIGAHAGVNVIDGFYEAIYNRIASTVINSNAERQSLRNDLALTVHNHILPDTTRPFTATGYWTAGTFRYVNSDTLQARTSRFGYRFAQGFGMGDADLTLALEGWHESLRRNSNALPDSLDPSRSALHLSAALSIPLGPFSAVIEPGLHKNELETFVGGRGRLSLDQGWLNLFAELSFSGQTTSWVQQFGWGDTMVPLSETPGSRVTGLRAGVGLKGGPFNLDVSGFLTSTSNYVDYFRDAQTDSISASIFSSDVQWAGVTASLGFRKDANRGIYLTFTPTVYQLSDANSTAQHSILAASLPELYVQGRFGLRYQLFRGDLDLDLYTKARLWSSFDSRTLHPETGLLALRPVGSRPVDSSIVMDVVAEAGIRTATIFLSFENVLSNPSLIVGNLLVPDYPLPAQRFRLGVYWPIRD